jgi:hypothetical protein
MNHAGIAEGHHVQSWFLFPPSPGASIVGGKVAGPLSLSLISSPGEL